MNEATARSIYKEKDKIRAQGKLPNLNPGSSKLGALTKVQGKKRIQTALSIVDFQLGMLAKKRVKKL